MERPRLTTKQAAALRDRIRPMLHFLHRCKRRLEALGFLEKSEIFQAVSKAHTAVHGLFMTAHYESCASGVWKTSEERSGPPAPDDQAQTPPSQGDA
jgi:hypothetical protein